MRKIAPITVFCCCCAFLAAVDLPQANADQPGSKPSPASVSVSPDLPKLVTAVTDAILEHHIDPPARQQMVLSGIRAVYEAAGVPIPSGLSRRVSAQATPEQLAAVIMDVWPKSSAKGLSSKQLEETFLGGLLVSIPGEGELISAKERKVADQVAGNRYVGIHIALKTDKEQKRPQIAELFKGGPADKAGVKDHDFIEQIDGVDTKGMLLMDAVDRLRGDDGTDVTIVVRQPKEQKTRTIKITRGQLPHATARGIRKLSDGEWKTRFDGPGAVGFIRIIEISASTPHELRKLARRAESEGVDRVVLDLRGIADGDSTHQAVLLADSLLESGTIGRVRTAKGEVTFQAEADAVFRGLPMAVLIDHTTQGTAEWLAAALQDNHRATLVGTPTRRSQNGMHRAMDGPIPGAVTVVAADAAPAVVRSTVAVADGAWSVTLVTGILERGNGQPLGGPAFSLQSLIPDGRILRIDPPEREKPPKLGVTPDHVVNQAKPRQSSSRRQDDDYDVTADETVKEAARILRAGAPAAATTASRNGTPAT